MGRALAVSKLSVIKNTVENLEKNFKQENQALMDQANAMLQKHQPSILEEAPVTALSQKATQIMSEFPKINELEKTLEIQE